MMLSVGTDTPVMPSAWQTWPPYSMMEEAIESETAVPLDPSRPTSGAGEGAPERVRRRRRTREDVVERICDAARQLFAERGYSGTTTREIARVADVSETLLFRHFGSKAALFDEVVCAPFNGVMQAFLEERAKLSDEDQRRAGEHHIFVAIYELFEKNQSLFTALLSTRRLQNEDTGPLPFDGLLSFYKEGTRQQLAAYAACGEEPSFDLALGLRLAFGMLAGSVLLRDWLFPDRSPPRDEIVHVLEKMVSRALDPGGQR